MEEKRESVGAIWVRTSKAGREYFSIVLDGKNYVAFTNKFKTEGKHPHYRIFEQQERTLPVVTDDDIPF